MPLMRLRCYTPKRHMASTNCNVFASATNVTLVTRVVHPSFILLLVCIVLLCQNLFSNTRRPPAHPGMLGGLRARNR